MITRKEKKSLKKRKNAASRLDNFEDIGDFEELSKLTTVNNNNEDEYNFVDDTTLKNTMLNSKSAIALQKAVKANPLDEDDYFDDLLNENNITTARRSSPDENMFDDDKDIALHKDYRNKKKRVC